MAAARTRVAAIPLVVAVVLAVAWTLAGRRQPVHVEQPALPALPVVALLPAHAGAVTRIELTRPDDDAPARLQTIVLEKRGAVWRMTAPLRTAASADKVEALLANLQRLRVWQRLDAGTTFYDRYDLTPAGALHVVVYAGTESRKVVDFYAGKGSEQGQLVRVPTGEGLFALLNWGPGAYQGFLYTRDVRGWRDPGVLSFDVAAVASVQIVNPHGAFVFTKGQTGWSGTFARRRAGAVGPARPLPGFQVARLDEMLQQLHALGAEDFGDRPIQTHAGVDDAERAGGIVIIRLAQASRPLVLRVGALASQGSRFAIAGSRWAVTDGQDSDDGTLYALSPWTARWATADVPLFQRRR